MSNNIVNGLYNSAKFFARNSLYTGLIIASLLSGGCGGGGGGGGGGSPVAPIVGNQAPIVNAGEDKNVRYKASVPFTTSAEDPDGTIATKSNTIYDKDHTPLFTTNDSIFNYKFDKTGSYTLEAIASDNEGKGATDTASISAYGNVPPTVYAGNDQTVRVNTTVNLNAIASDSDGTISSYIWKDASGNTILTDPTGPYTLTSPGIKSITVAVTDNDGATANDSVIYTVTPNATPTANVGTTATGTVGESITLDGSVSKDSDGTITNYLWDLGNGTFSNLASTSIIFTKAGTYNIPLTVTDNEGSTDTATKTITIDDAVTYMYRTTQKTSQTETPPDMTEVIKLLVDAGLFEINPAPNAFYTAVLNQEIKQTYKNNVLFSEAPTASNTLLLDASGTIDIDPDGNNGFVTNNNITYSWSGLPGSPLSGKKLTLNNLNLGQTYDTELSAKDTLGAEGTTFPLPISVSSTIAPQGSIRRNFSSSDIALNMVQQPEYQIQAKWFGKSSKEISDLEARASKMLHKNVRFIKC